MIVIVVTQPGAPRGLLRYALELAGLETREVVSVEQADSVVRRTGSRNCVVVIEAESLSDAPRSGTWRTFLRSWSELPVVAIARADTHDSIRDLVARRDRILLENPFDAAAVVAAVRKVAVSARSKRAMEAGTWTGNSVTPASRRAG